MKQFLWGQHPPALVDTERKTVEWSEIPAAKLQETMKTHLPVCRNRHIAETIRREHAGLVLDRALDPLSTSAYK
jgi:hypothetical protein